MSDSRRRLASLLVAALAVSGCVAVGDRGVIIRSIETRVVFGFAANDDTLFTPAPLPPPPTTIPQLADVPRFPQSPPPVFVFEPPPPIDPGPCPEPPRGAFPAAAPDRVRVLPTEGTYPWFNTAEIDGVPVQNLTGFSDHAIDSVSGNVSDSDTATPTAFTYRWSRRHPVFNADSEETIEIRQSLDLQAPPGVPPWAFVPVSGPTDGLRLSAWTLRDGDATSTFAPPESLLLVPLPIDPAAEPWTDTQSDPVGGVTVVVNGSFGVVDEDGTRIVKRVVNACGAPIESWVVSLDLIVTQGTESVTYPWVLDFAPQLGGLIVADEFGYDTTSEFGTLRVHSFHKLGATEPSGPPPEGAG